MSRLTDLTLQLHHETPMAILVSDSGLKHEAVWLPKSEIEYVPISGKLDMVEVTLPEWLATAKGLV